MDIIVFTWVVSVLVGIAVLLAVNNIEKNVRRMREIAEERFRREFQR